MISLRLQVLYLLLLLFSHHLKAKRQHICPLSLTYDPRVLIAKELNVPVQKVFAPPPNTTVLMFGDSNFEATVHTFSKWAHLPSIEFYMPVGRNGSRASKYVMFRNTSAIAHVWGLDFLDRHYSFAYPLTGPHDPKIRIQKEVPNSYCTEIAQYLPGRTYCSPDMIVLNLITWTLSAQHELQKRTESQKLPIWTSAKMEAFSKEFVVNTSKLVEATTIGFPSSKICLYTVPVTPLWRSTNVTQSRCPPALVRIVNSHVRQLAISSRICLIDVANAIGTASQKTMASAGVHYTRPVYRALIRLLFQIAKCWSMKSNLQSNLCYPSRDIAHESRGRCVDISWISNGWFTTSLFQIPQWARMQVSTKILYSV